MNPPMSPSGPRTFQQKAKKTLSNISTLVAAGAITLGSGTSYAAAINFGPDNPFYSASTLPFQAPPFDKIKDSDYQPAIEAGMAEQIREVGEIADNPAAPTFENTLMALEKTGSCSIALWRRSTESPARIPILNYKKCRASKRRSWQRCRTPFF